MQQLTELAAVALETHIEFFVQTRKFAQADQDGSVDPNRSKTMLIRSHRVCQHKGVLSIILGPRRKIAIAEPIQLFRIDREDAKVPRK